MHTAEIFDLLSMCANLALTIKTNIGESITLDLGGYVMSLHGCGQSSAVEMTNVFEEDCKDRFQSVYWSRQQREVLEGSLLTQFRSPCPQECDMHAGMATSMKPRASVSVEYDMKNGYILWAKRQDRDEEGMAFLRR